MTAEDLSQCYLHYACLADSVILSSEFWTSPVVIQQRAVQVISGEQL